MRKKEPLLAFGISIKALLKLKELLTRSQRYSEFIIFTSQHTKSNKEMLLFGVKYFNHDKMSVDWDDMASQA